MLEADVLIIGAGPAGLSAAAGLADRGLTSLVVDRDSRPGGHAASLACKATDNCARCNACLLEETLSELAGDRHHQLLFSAEVKEIGPVENERRTVVIEFGPGTVEASVRAVIAAAGLTPFDPAGKPKFAYGRLPGVISALELEERLRQNGLADLPGRIAFIQCVGSRDKSIGRDYCSRICCGYALRLARVLRHRSPETEVVFFYMDVQTFGRDFDRWFAEVRDFVELVHGIPGEVMAGPEESLRLPFFNETSGQKEMRDFDLVVLSVGLGPPQGGLAETLGLTVDEDGFWAEGPQGIFPAGAACGPMDVAEARADGGRAAAATALYLGGGQS